MLGRWRRAGALEAVMKDGNRFVDCDMHIIEPADLFERYMDPAFKSRITAPVRKTSSTSSGTAGVPRWIVDGLPMGNDGNTSQYNRIRGPLAAARGNENVRF